MYKHFELIRSLKKNSQEPVEAVVTGYIPRWVEGTLYRNGAGRYEYGEKCYEHLFDGHACIHKFKIKDGKVIYSNKMLETNSFKKTLAENRLYPVFGTPDLCSNIFGRLKTVYKFDSTMDNVNVNVLPFGGDDLYALTETNYICKLDPTSLNILNTIDISKSIKTTSTTIAHPHIEDDGSWIIAGLSAKKAKLHYEFLRYKNQQPLNSKNICDQSEVIASIPSSHLFSLSYFHSFGMTNNYIVFLELPLRLSLPSYFCGLFNNKSFADALIMDPNFDTKIYIINKKTGEVIKKKFYTDPIFVFHHINAYEKHDANSNLSEIIVDVCAYDPNYFSIKDLTYEDMFTEKLLDSKKMRAIARRISVPMNKEEHTNTNIYCKIEDLNSTLAFELPTINYSRFNGKPYKYFYAANYQKSPFSIVKVNVENPYEVIEKKYFLENYKFLPSEPIFIENPNPKSEDDGVLVVIVLSNKNDYLSIIDANTMIEVARADLPAEIECSITFHGFFADVKNYEKLNS